MSKVSPSEAIRLSGKARQTVYDALNKGELSYELKGKKKLIDVSELERWAGPLKNPDKQEVSKDVSEDKSRMSSGKDTAQNQVLRAALEKEQAERRREREDLIEQRDVLLERIKSHEAHQKSLSLLLTDQRDQEKKDAERRHREEMNAVKARMLRLEQALREEKNKSFLEKWLGIGSKKKAKRPLSPADRQAQKA